MAKNPKSSLTEKAHWTDRYFVGQCRFVTSGADYQQLPIIPQLEIAFAGRSNCGKSSLLNGLMGTKSLARTSNTPGRTRLFNFFAAGDHLVMLDLPGYGYAKANQNDRNDWQAQFQGYIRARTALRHIFVLIDARRGVLEIDENLMASLDKKAIPFSIILTKADKIPAPVGEELRQEIQKIILFHPAAKGEVLLSSAKTFKGIRLLRETVLSIIGITENAKSDTLSGDTLLKRPQHPTGEAVGNLTLDQFKPLN